MSLSLVVTCSSKKLLSGINFLDQLVGNGQLAIGGIKGLCLFSGKCLVKNAELVDFALEAGHIAYVLVLADNKLHHAGRQILSPATATDL